MTTRPPVTALAPVGLVLLSLVGGCAAAGALVGEAVGTSVVAGVNPAAPLTGPSGRYVANDAAPGEVALRELSFDGGGTTISARVTSPHPVGLRRARLAPIDAAPCGGGSVADHLWLDELRRWDRPVGWEGAHELVLHFPARAALRRPTALDVTIMDGGHERCMRTTLGAPGAAPLVRGQRLAAGGDLGLVMGAASFHERAPFQSGALYGFTLSGSLGAWVGWWRMGGRLDACFLGCSYRSFVTAPLTATVERIFGTGRWLTVGASLGYQVGRLDDLLHALERHATWVEGPRAALLLLGPRPFAGAAAGEGFAARGLELSVLRLFEPVRPAGLVDPPRVAPGWIFGVAAIGI